MSVEHIDFLVEESSMETALRKLVPKIIGNMSFEVHPFLCKDDLLLKLRNRLVGYAAWIPDTWRVVIIVDRDDDDCHMLKSRLEGMAADVGLVTRSCAHGGPYVVVNRLAIEELEAWYFGDWEAVRTSYPRVSRTIPAQAGYRNPDSVAGGTWEAFERILRRAGYFKEGLAKIEAADTVASNMDPTRNRSRSFQVLRSALEDLAAIP